MKIKRILFGLIVLSLLACNFVTQAVFPPTATQAPPPSTASQSPTATFAPSPTVTTTALAPAYIPPKCTSSPLATLPADSAIQATPDFQITEISKEEQLSILKKLEQIIQTVYVYPDYNGRDWNGMKAKYEGEVQAGLTTESFYKEMSALIEGLGDNHSFFLSPSDVKESEAELKGDVQFVGIGISAKFDKELQHLVVIATFPGSPADHAGIQSHDSIVMIDHRPIDEQYSRRLRGPQCSAVVLTVQSPGGKPHDVMVLRYAIDGDIPVEARLVTTRDGSKIGYIFIPSFFDETIPGQIKNALDKFGHLDSLILDLRMNGGGSSSVVYPILSYFIHGKLGEFFSRTDKRPLEIQANEIQNSLTVPLVVMVSKDTVSFGEIFSGILQDSGRAKVVGETSAGNVEILHGFDFEDGSQVWLAAEVFHSGFSNTIWEGKGIVPNVQAFAPWDTFTFDNDPSVAAAIKLLGHQ